MGYSIKINNYIRECLVIKDKAGNIIPLAPNAPQMKLYNAIKTQAEAGKPQRVIVLKARQMGFSTLTEALIFARTATQTNISSAIVTHKDEATTHLFEMSKLYYQHLPATMRPALKASNAKELIFNRQDGRGLNSRIKCMTAGGEAIGRSDTLQNLHISEYAFWSGNKKNTLIGLLQSVPNHANTMVVIESTANGFEHFKELWDKAVAGENDFAPVFCAWYELPEYQMSADGLKLTAEEQEIKDKYNLTPEQMAWRQHAIKNLCGGDINLFRQEYPSNPNEAFLTSGECIFDKEAIVARLDDIYGDHDIQGEFFYKKELKPIISNGVIVATEKIISDIHFVEVPNGMITLHEQSVKKTDANGNVFELEPYTIGGDTAGLGNDYYTAKVVSNIDGRTMATLRKQRIDEDKYAEQVYCLGQYYNNALIGIETNYSRVPMRELDELGYKNLYRRERVDTTTREVQKVLGFETTGTTKPVIIQNLVALMRDSPEAERDEATLREMLTFVRKENGKTEAQQGYHDDLIMAKAIANFIALQQGEKNFIKVERPQREMTRLDRIYAGQEKENENNGGWLQW